MGPAEPTRYRPRQTDRAVPTAPSARSSRRWLAVGAWLVATALVAAAFHAIGWERAVLALRQARVPWLVVAALLNGAIIPLWAWQSRVFLPAEHRVAFGRLCEVTALATTASNTIPAFVGQAAGVGLLAERGGVGAAVALSVFAQHQVVEGIAKVAMLAAAASVAPLPPWMHDALVALVAAVAGLTVVLIGAAAWAARGGGSEPGRVQAFVARWGAGLVALRSPRRFAIGLAIALLMKLAEAGGWLAVERAFGVAPRPGSPFLALAAVNVASTASLSPGNLGVYEGAAYVVYTSLRLPGDVAFALAVAGHLCYLVPLVGCGWVVLSLKSSRA